MKESQEQNFIKKVGSREYKELPIPEGVIVSKLVSVNMEDYPPSKNNQVYADGVKSLYETILKKDEELWYHNKELAGSEKIESTLGTEIDLSNGMNVFVLDTNLDAKKINQITQTALELNLVFFYNEFTQKTIKNIIKNDTRIDSLSFSYRTARKANPELFETGDDKTLNLSKDTNDNFNQIGFIVEKMKSSTDDMVNEMIMLTEKLEQLGVVTINDNSHGAGLHWPIKTELKKLKEGHWKYKENKQ